jgi:hypothetical protein
VRSLLLSPRWLVRHVVAILLIGACFGLAWWQWGRANSLSGTAQNIGYALQWPAFGAFVAYAWYRMLRLELNPPSADSDTKTTAPDGSASASDGSAPRTVQVRRRYRPTDAPERSDGAAVDDPQLTAYNAYLSALNHTRRNDQ